MRRKSFCHARVGKDPASKVLRLLEDLGDADPAHTDGPGILAFSSYTGKYRYGDTDSDVLEVFERRGRLSIKTTESFPFNLFHLR